jgi:hypothetical protein
MAAMAWVTSIELKSGSGQVVPDRVGAHAVVFRAESDALIVELKTFSEERSSDDTNSEFQSLQFGEQAAHQLYRILKDTYKFQD